MTNLPPVPDGATVFTHPQQGKTVYLMSDGTMQCYRADGRKATTSATPAKLLAGYGAWEQVEGDAPAAAVAPPPKSVASLYIAPQLAQEAALTMLPKLAVDEGIVFEQKLDGHRVMLVSPGGDAEPVALTRNGQPYTKGLPKRLREWRFPEGNGYGEMILDGELVGDTFWVFDMPYVKTICETGMPLRSRRYLLEQFFENWSKGNPAIRLVPQAKTIDEKRALAERALTDGFEGLVAKRKESPYRAGGRTEEWLKLKFVTTADCFVTGVRTDGKDSVDLGMIRWTGSGILKDSFEVVDVGRASLIGKEKKGAINKGDVIEVRYLYVGAGGRLYQPTIVGKRDDKAMHECDVASLKHVNKTVMETL